MSSEENTQKKIDEILSLLKNKKTGESMFDEIRNLVSKRDMENFKNDILSKIEETRKEILDTLYHMTGDSEESLKTLIISNQGEIRETLGNISDVKKIMSDQNKDTKECFTDLINIIEQHHRDNFTYEKLHIIRKRLEIAA